MIGCCPQVDPRYEVTKDVRGQIKFLEELDKAEQKRHEEQEREMLMRAAKSRSKTEDPEQAKLKAKVKSPLLQGRAFCYLYLTASFLSLIHPQAKEMQRAEMEELRQRDANLTALQAIGPRKKPKLEEGSSTSSTVSTLIVDQFTVLCFADLLLSCNVPVARCVWYWVFKREGADSAASSNQAGQSA